MSAGDQEHVNPKWIQIGLAASQLEFVPRTGPFAKQICQFQKTEFPLYISMNPKPDEGMSPSWGTRQERPLLLGHLHILSSSCK